MKQLAPFSTLEQSARKMIADAETIALLPPTEANAKVARAMRLEIKPLRVAVEKRHAELKRPILDAGNALDDGKNALLDLLKPMEAKLLAIEQHAEREALRIEDEKRATRHAEISPFLTGPLSVDLGKMPDDEYAKVLADAKDLAQLREERARKEKEAAAAQAKAEAEEREHIRVENERLKKEAEEAKAEKVRLNTLENMILAIREGETDAIRVCKTIESLEKEIAYVEKREVTEDIFQERFEEAKEVKASVLASMRTILDDKRAVEARKAEVAAEREAALVEQRRIQAESDAREKAAAEKARKELEAANQKAAEEARIAAAKARKEREEIEAKAKAEREEAAERAAKEAEFARKARDKADAKAKVEREALEAVARKEQEIREKLEAEIAAKKAAEEKAETDRLAAEEAAALAPEKEKLLALATVIRELPVPILTTEKGAVAMQEIAAKVEAFAACVEKKAGSL